jgi:endonuclease/exonuclease/phosphatase (EEP) superfamily protein YafD
MALYLQLLNPTPTALKLATNNLVPTYYILLQNGFDRAKEHKRVLHTSTLTRYSGRTWKKYRLASTMKNKCSVIQANLHNSRCATLETLAYIRQENIDIALCQEPYNYKTSRGTYTIPALMNQRLIANNDNRFFSCLLVNNPTLNVLHLRHLSSKYVTVVSIDGISTESVFVISIYAPPNNDSIRNMVTKLQQIVTNLQDKTVLLGGDFNCRSTIWFDTLCDRNSPVLEDFILANDLVIFNEDNLPSTFSSDQVTSILP